MSPSAARWWSGTYRLRPRHPAASCSASRPAACAAATGTAGWATTPTSRCRTCRGTSWPAPSRRSGADVRRLAGRRPRHRAVRLRLRQLRRCAWPATSRSATHQTQPGFTHWGSFAELVVARARRRQPRRRCRTSCPSPSRPALGCRFATAVPRGRRSRAGCAPGEWVAVHGCGGVGLSAVHGRGRRRRPGRRGRRRPRSALALARAARRARRCLDAARAGRRRRVAADAVRDATGGGAHAVPRRARQPGTCAARCLALRPPRPARPGRACCRRPSAARRCRWTGSSALELEIARQPRHGRALAYPAMLGARRRRPAAAGAAGHPRPLPGRGRRGVRRPRCRPRHRGGHPVLSLRRTRAGAAPGRRPHAPLTGPSALVLTAPQSQRRRPYGRARTRPAPGTRSVARTRGGR